MNIYNKNIKWLKKNSQKCFINHEVSDTNIIYRVVESKVAEKSTLIAILNKTPNSPAIEEISIHSLFNPHKEAEQIASSIDIKNDYCIILGLGLGYVAQAIRNKYPTAELVLIEPDKSLFYLALKHCDLENLRFSQIYVGHDDAGIKSIFAPPHLLRGMGGATLYIQKSQERISPSLYTRIKNIFHQTPNYTLSDQWKYQKFSTQQCKILFIDSGYVLSKECLMAIKNTGHLAHYIHIDIDHYDYEQFIKKLMQDIICFKPDFVLTINHLGFDKEGRLTSLFDDLQLPFVSWFVDSPNVVLSSYDLNISDFCNIFVWDDDYISQVKEKGYKNCDYLPLATDTSIFYPQTIVYKYNVSFVGSSMVSAIHKNMKSWVHRDDLISDFPNLVNSFLAQKTRHVEAVLKDKNIIFDHSDQEEDFKAAILWKATQIYRQSGISALADFIPTISGDPGWVNLLPIEYEILRERWYYEDLCDFYNQSKINFNMTSLQMTNAVNQRVFDVSACNQFLLTDFRKQILEIFETKDNLVWFNEVGEMSELLDFYLKNENLRKKISQNAYEIVSKGHTYNHRISKMINILKQRYKG